MGKYDEAANKAATETDKELVEEIKQLNSSNISQMFPEPANQEAVNELIAAINKSTDKNEMATAYKVFAVKATRSAVDIFNTSFKIAKKLVV